MTHYVTLAATATPVIAQARGYHLRQDHNIPLADIGCGKARARMHGPVLCTHCPYRRCILCPRFIAIIA